MRIKNIVCGCVLAIISCGSIAYAGECGKLKNDAKILNCFQSKANKLKNNTYKLINKNKKLQKEQITYLKKSLDYWEKAQIALCQYSYLSGIKEIDVLNQAACMIEQWDEKLVTTKKNLDEITSHAVVFKNVPEPESMAFSDLNSKYNKVLRNTYLNQISYDKFITLEKAQFLNEHIVNWQEYAINYARAHNWQQTLQQLIAEKKEHAQQQIDEIKKQR